MGLSRKREKELKKLKSTASELWEEQLEVLGHASSVVREAGRQIGNASREDIVPRVRETVDQKIMPAVSSGIEHARTVYGDARDKVTNDVLPGVAASVAAAVSSLDSASDPRVREAMRQVRRTTERVGKSASKVSKSANKALAEASMNATKTYDRVGKKVGLVAAPKKGMGVGGYFLIALGVVAVIALAYAAWQTLRADDELWVVDEDETGAA